MSKQERRRSDGKHGLAALRSGLTPEQLATLHTLEQFRWTLEFVRRPLFQTSIPVVTDRERKRCAVLEPDGSINEQAGLKLRD